MQVQGSSRPDALKFQAAQPPAVTQGPGNHRLEHGQVNQGAPVESGQHRGAEMCVTYMSVLCAVDTGCGRLVLVLFAGPRRGDQAAARQA
jgi:hypothetical protein